MVCHCHSPLESLNLHDLLCDFFFGFWYLPNKSQTFSGRVRTHSFAFIASLPDESKDYLLKLKMIRNLPAGVLVIRLPWFEDMFYIMHTNIDNYINYIYMFSHKLYCRCFHTGFEVQASKKAIFHFHDGLQKRVSGLRLLGSASHFGEEV